MADETTNQNPEQDINTVKEDIQKLRDNLNSLLGDVTAYSKEKLSDTRDRVSAAVTAFKGRASGQVQETAQTVRRKGQQVAETSRNMIKKNPLACTAAAFVTGALVSHACKCKGKRR
jgi:ElaB/YqjD/DUF883 family membrane-anchored ribosome-binding protein